MSTANMEYRSESVDQAAVKRIMPFVRPQLDPEQLPPDYLALLSLCCGVLGLMFKVSNEKHEEGRTKGNLADRYLGMFVQELFCDVSKSASLAKADAVTDRPANEQRNTHTTIRPVLLW